MLWHVLSCACLSELASRPSDISVNCDCLCLSDALFTATGSPDQSNEQIPSFKPPRVEGQRLVYSNRCGRVRLNNVTVQNRGVDYNHEHNVYWQHKVNTSTSFVSCDYALYVAGMLGYA